MILFTSGGDTKSFHKNDKWKKSWQIKPKRVEKENLGKEHTVSEYTGNSRHFSRFDDFQSLTRNRKMKLLEKIKNVQVQIIM